ncbi:MAG TPA: Gfo/Idh/MocA family oxidoreductase [bacterium]|nr:Gfo/Idh/MocA family oxidoreductase [bacterium]
MVNVGVIGYGYWGPNLVRNFASFTDVRIKTICDTDPEKLKRAASRYPDTCVTDNSNSVFDDKDIDAVILSLPAEYHAEFAGKALVSGKHVFVEKPLAMTVSDAEKLVKLSENSNRILMVGLLLLYHPAVKYLRSLIDKGELGRIYYLYSQRLNLGLIRTHENSLWSLAPHDISILLYLLDEDPASVSATGASYIQDGIEDTVFLHLKFSDRKMAHVHVSWLDPNRVRKITVVGQNKMAVFDDVEPVDKIKIFDKGVKSPTYSSYGESLSLRFGDINIPHIEMTEPLRIECRHFIDCINNGQKPATDADYGLKVVRVLEAAHKSLKTGGAEIIIGGTV